MAPAASELTEQSHRRSTTRVAFLKWPSRQRRANKYEEQRELPNSKHERICLPLSRSFNFNFLSPLLTFSSRLLSLPTIFLKLSLFLCFSCAITSIFIMNDIMLNRLLKTSHRFATPFIPGLNDLYVYVYMKLNFYFSDPS